MSITLNRLTIEDHATPVIQRVTGQLHELTFTQTRKQVQSALGMVAWWALCIVVPIVAVVCGTIYGAIVGAASGAAAGVTEAKTDLARWWEAMK